VPATFPGGGAEVKVAQFVTNVNSADPERLTAFYRDTLGLTPNADFGPGAFMAGSADFIALIIESHSEVTGPAKDPARVILNFIVEDIRAEQSRLETAGVAFSMPATHSEGFGWVATFADPDGNLCQLMQLGG
jgi:predicted enzyme related to lactoylglutathione lyase